MSPWQDFNPYAMRRYIGHSLVRFFELLARLP